MGLSESLSVNPIIGPNDWIFGIQHLLSNKKEHVHGTQLKLFRNSDYELTEEMDEHLRFQQGELFIVSEILDIRKKHGKIELLASWFGLDEATWETLDHLRDDVPEMVEDYLNHLCESGSPADKRLARSCA